METPGSLHPPTWRERPTLAPRRASHLPAGSWQHPGGLLCLPCSSLISPLTSVGQGHHFLNVQVVLLTMDLS